MKAILQTVVGFAIAAFAAIMFGARMMLDLIGYTTAGDDFSLFKQRFPKMLEWLFSTPWWVPSLLMAGMVALAAWLIVSGTKRAAAEEIVERVGLDESAVGEIVERYLAAMPKPEQRTDLATHADLHRQDESIAELTDRITSVRGMIESSHEGLKARLDEIAKGCFDLQRKIDDWTHQHTASNEQRFKNVDGGFRAIHDREKLLQLVDGIREDAHWLLRAREGEKIDNWGQWSAKLSAWSVKVADYGQIAEYYLPDVPRAIIDVPPHKLQGDWPEDRNLFPSDDAMIAHRTVAVTLNNFWEQHPRVMRAVTSWAFTAPSMKGKPSD